MIYRAPDLDGEDLEEAKRGRPSNSASVPNYVFRTTASVSVSAKPRRMRSQLSWRRWRTRQTLRKSAGRPSTCRLTVRVGSPEVCCFRAPNGAPPNEIRAWP